MWLLFVHRHSNLNSLFNPSSCESDFPFLPLSYSASSQPAKFFFSVFLFPAEPAGGGWNPEEEMGYDDTHHRLCRQASQAVHSRDNQPVRGSLLLDSPTR